MSGETLTMETEPIAVWTGDTVLNEARSLASNLDPPHAATYHSMSASRWSQAMDLGLELLTAHAAHRLHHTPGRGRREHAREVHVLLDEANAANLVAAVALLLVMGRILDRSPREGREDGPCSCRSVWT